MLKEDLEFGYPVSPENRSNTVGARTTDLAAEDKQAFVAALARQHGERLRRFLAARLRYAIADVPDLVQEVYLRLLRVPHHESIRSPQAYLFTVAYHVLHQHKLSLSSTPESVDIMDTIAELETFVEADPSNDLDTHQRLEALDRALKELSPKTYATFVLHRRYCFTLEEIGVQLGVSRPMVKKYLSKAVAHCRQRFEGTE